MPQESESYEVVGIHLLRATSRLMECRIQIGIEIFALPFFVQDSLLDLKEKHSKLQCEKEGREAAHLAELAAARAEADRQLQQLTQQLQDTTSRAQVNKY
jgi:hypothetical protein